VLLNFELEVKLNLPSPGNKERHRVKPNEHLSQAI